MKIIISNINYDEFRSWISLLFSLFSLLIAFYTILINRKHLDVTIEDEYSIIKEVYRDDDAFLSHAPTYTVPNGYIGMVIYIKVVNPSPNNIAFFDLSIIDKDTNQLVQQIVKGNLHISKNNPAFSYAGFNRTNCIRLNLLDSNYGMFEANSFKRIELVAIVPETSKEITVSFKIAKSTILKNKNATLRAHFKSYSHNFFINPNSNCSNISILGVNTNTNIDNQSD